MTDARPQIVSQASISRVAAIMVAGLLIFAGIVFQLGELAWGRLNEDGLWLVHMIAMSIWNLLAIRMNAPELVTILHFWPLMLVVFGLAILLALQPARE